MNERIMDCSVDGTVALKPVVAERTHTARIIEFPSRNAETAGHINTYDQNPSQLQAIRNRVTGVLYASEMYCSLVFEDARGVLYDMFSRNDVRILSVASCAVAVLSIAFGA